MTVTVSTTLDRHSATLTPTLAPKLPVIRTEDISVSTRPGFYELSKRVEDFVLSLVLIALLAPLMAIVAAAIKLTSHGTVIFKQTRAGVNGQPFTMYKFRTMRMGAQEDRVFLEHMNEKSGPIFKIAEDPRLTFVGRLLRRSSIDEIPQLFNVLAGSMSLVGPRPLWWPEAQQVTGQDKRRMTVKPGMTGLWQISGRSELSYEQAMKIDLYYVRHRSLLLDLLILFQTLPAVLSTHGAY